jgi:signal transduction histidine kinase
MRQRMESVRGSFEMESRPEQGTRVRIRLPLRTAG